MNNPYLLVGLVLISFVAVLVGMYVVYRVAEFFRQQYEVDE